MECTGAELKEQVAYLRGEYESVGDQLEQEQSRSNQVCLSYSGFCLVFIEVVSPVRDRANAVANVCSFVLWLSAELIVVCIVGNMFALFL